MVKIAVVFALSTLSCSRSAVAATATTAIEFRKHGMKDDAASRDMESLLWMQDQELPNNNNNILIKQQQQSQTNHWTVQEKENNDSMMVRPTERARRKGYTVTNSNEGYTYVPIDKFAMVVTSTKTKTTTKSSVVDLETLRDALVTSLDHHFRMSNYSDKYIIFDSVTLAGVSIHAVPTSDRRGRQLVNEEQFNIIVEGGVALFQTFISTPSYEKIQTIVKTSIGSDDLIQKMKTSNLFPDLTSIQSIDDPSSIQTPSPLPATTTPPTVSPTTTSPTTTTTTTKNTSPTKRNPNQIQSSSQYSSSSSDSSTFAVVLSIVCISIGVLVVSIALFVKKRRYDRKEWCTDNFNHQHDLNLASMDSQPVYNTGVVSLGEQSYIDNDIYTDQQRRKYPTATVATTIPATSSSSDNNHHTNSAFRDNLLEMTRNLFVNFGSDKSTDSKSRGHSSLEPTLPPLFDEEKWKNMHQAKKKKTTTTTKTEPSSPDANATVSTVDVDDLESPSPSPVKRYNTIAKPIPLSKRMRSTSSTSTMSENHIDLEPDTAWDPNDNDADSDVASIDAQFMIT